MTLIETVGKEMNARKCDGYIINDKNGRMIAGFVQCLNMETKRAQEAYCESENVISCIKVDDKYDENKILIVATVI